MTDLEILKARAAAVPAGEMVAVYAETVLALIEENERLKEACLALEMALSEAGDDYPGSAMQEWCVQQIERAHQIMRGH